MPYAMSLHTPPKRLLLTDPSPSERGSEIYSLELENRCLTHIWNFSQDLTLA